MKEQLQHSREKQKIWESSYVEYKDMNNPVVLKKAVKATILKVSVI